jgi:hypothetical protein
LVLNELEIMREALKSTCNFKILREAYAVDEAYCHANDDM